MKNTKISISVCLTPKMRLKQALKEAGVKDPATVSKLTVSGTLDYDDFKYIRAKMAETLQELDMGDVSFYKREINNWDFERFSYLISITIPASIEHIGIHEAGFDFWIFSDCINLNNITVHPNNSDYASENGVLFNKDKTELLIYPQGRQGDYIIPDSVVTIDDYAFKNCAGLTSVFVPASVLEFDNNVFNGCTVLTSIAVHPENFVFTSENGILFNKNKSKLLFCPEDWQGDYVIPDSVVEIEEDAFSECSGLTSIVIPTSVDVIGKWAFSGCTGLTSIIIPNSVTKIGNGAFSSCECLTSINIPDSVDTIKFMTFNDCKGLTSINIPNSVTEICYNAFDGCSGLTSVTLPDSLVEIDINDFSNCADMTFVHVPTIENLSFLSDCNALTSITVHPDNPVFTLENGVLFNGDKTKLICFSREEADDSINDPVEHYAIPDTVIEIKDDAFNNCERLINITIPASVKKIGKSAYFSWYAFISITVHPDNTVYASENGVLFNKEKTELIRFPKGLKGEYVIPDSVKKIGEYAFLGCVGLTSIILPDSIEEIDNSAFGKCINLTSINLPDSVKKIGSSVFSYCESLTCITVPNSVKEIGVWAFDSCINLTAISIPASVTDIGYSSCLNHAFTRCGAYITVHPDNPVYESENGKIKHKRKTKKYNQDIYTPLRQKDVRGENN